MMSAAQDLQQTLGTQYLMFYHPAVCVTKLTPVQTIQQSIDCVNQQLRLLGHDVLTWPAQHQEEIARLMLVNWMYQRLTVEPIRKPILVHREQQQWLVDCGDTRLMALNLQHTVVSVGVIVTCQLRDADLYADWHPVHTSQQLLQHTGFDCDHGHVFFTAADQGVPYALSWLEIGDQTTAHHLHDIAHRISMMQRYLDCQASNFEFSTAWARECINWQ